MPVKSLISKRFLELQKIPGRRYWYIRGKFDGVNVFVSTKTENEEAARLAKVEFESGLCSTSRGSEGAAATFQEAADLYLEFRDPSKPQRESVKKLCKLLGPRLLTDLRQHAIVSAAVELYPDCSPATRNRMAITPAAAVIHYAAENNLCPYVKIKRFKEKKPEPRAVTKEAASALIDGAEGQMKALLVFLFCQGWRISDVLDLQWKDIDFNGATVKYHVSKTDEWLTMPLHLRVLDMLREAKGDGEKVGRVFTWSDKQNVYRDLRPLCAKVGFRFTPHMARHSFATWLASEGVSTKDIMEAGAWRDFKSVMRYTKVDERQVRSTINKIRT